MITKKWYTVAEVAEMLGFGLSKTKMLVATGELRSLKDGKYRRILPEWVDEYVARRVAEARRPPDDRPRTRANGEGSIFPYRNGFAAYVWVHHPRRAAATQVRLRQDPRGGPRQVDQAARSRPGAGPSPPGRRRCRRLPGGLAAGRRAPEPRAGDHARTTRCSSGSTSSRTSAGSGSTSSRSATSRPGSTSCAPRCQCCAQGKDAARAEAAGAARSGQCCRQVASGVDDPPGVDGAARALTHAIREELVSRNVAALVRVPDASPPEGPGAGPVDEARRFLESARSDDDPLYAGLRPDPRARAAPRGAARPQLGRRRPRRRESCTIGLAAPAGRTATAAAARPRRSPRTPRCRCPTSALTALEHRQPSEQQWRRRRRARPGRTPGWSSPPATAQPIEPRNFHRSFKRALGSARASRSSPCTPPGGPARPCSSPSTCTPASPCRSCGTPRSRSRWRSTRGHLGGHPRRAQAARRELWSADCCTSLLYSAPNGTKREGPGPGIMPLTWSFVGGDEGLEPSTPCLQTTRIMDIHGHCRRRSAVAGRDRGPVGGTAAVLRCCTAIDHE